MYEVSYFCFITSTSVFAQEGKMEVGDDTEFFSEMDHTPRYQQSKKYKKADESLRVFSV